MSFTTSGKSSTIIFSNIVSATFSLPSFWNFNYKYILYPHSVLCVFYFSYLFSIFYFLCCSPDSFFWFIIQFAKSFISCISSDTKQFHWILNFGHFSVHFNFNTFLIDSFLNGKKEHSICQMILISGIPVVCFYYCSIHSGLYVNFQKWSENLNNVIILQKGQFFLLGTGKH